MTRRVVRGAITTVLAVLLTVAVTAPPAAASSRLVGRVTTPVGELQVWWDGAQNTAVMVRGGPAYGVRAWTMVQVCRFRGYGCVGPVGQDGGWYAYRAGPVGSGPSHGSCVYAHGEIDYAGTRYYANFLGACG